MIDESNRNRVSTQRHVDHVPTESRVLGYVTCEHGCNEYLWTFSTIEDDSDRVSNAEEGKLT